MDILAIDHVQLAMPAGQENQARDFYTKILGLIEIQKPPELAKRGGVWFENRHVKVHLGVEAEFRPAKKAHPAFLLSGIDELATKCRDFGLEVIDDEVLPSYKRIFVYDPFGNRLEFMEPNEA